MCEEPLIHYCSHKDYRLTNRAATAYLSPMNMLVVTLWYLKHYHSERYISSELNLSPAAVNYLLSTVNCGYFTLVCISRINFNTY